LYEKDEPAVRMALSMEYSKDSPKLKKKRHISLK